MEVCFLARRARGFFFTIAAGDVSLATDNGFHAMTLHRVVEGDRAEHVAMVRHGTCRHFQLFNTLGERFDLDGAVEKTVVSMKMKVYELAVLHFMQPIHGLRR